MRTLLLLPALLFLVSSCRYQYLTVASDHLTTNSNNEFVMETDTLLITYNFHGNRGPVRISIYNKSAEPIQIDWKRSSLIIGDNPITHFNPEMQILGTVETDRPLFNSRSYGRTSRLQGTIRSQEGIEFIPPASGITRSDLYLVGKGRVDTTSMHLKTEKIRSGAYYHKVKSGKFSRLSSPIPFRSFLTFVTAGAEARMFTVEHSFYISQLIDSYEQPTEKWLRSEQKGNEFYIGNGDKEKRGNTALVLGGIGAGILFVVAGTQQL